MLNARAAAVTFVPGIAAATASMVGSSADVCAVKLANR
jgi:hypothetical protein